MERRGDGETGRPQRSALSTQHPTGGAPALPTDPRAQHSAPKTRFALARIEPGASPCDHRWIVRFTGHQRAQHFIMMSSVLLLVFTGMPQKFFDT
ncbi:MAG: hypothetical protein M0Z94_04280, partial [Dehalococcoidales bacterium]|nr:hypothetical protein [Dehalococcoidales bacterium]